MSEVLKAPFPWFGGKSSVADEVWRRFGQVKNYIEPFFGSGACLLARPAVDGFETINDFDGLLANAWRAIKAAPELVAEHADWPVSECDLHARHAWLVGNRQNITSKLMGDAEFYDAKAAGWWLWGISSWIGSGWCSGSGPWIVIDGELVDSRKLPHLTEGKGIMPPASTTDGISKKLPLLSGGFSGNSHGAGINRKLPDISDREKGINRQLPDISSSEKGINRQLPALRGGGGAAGMEIHGASIRRAGLVQYFSDLSNRLRDVRVACGDFERVLGPSITTGIGLTAVFLDPPYDTESADCHDAYSTGKSGTAERARTWAISNGENDKFRIAICGYMGEHDAEMLAAGWSAFNWKARGGYGNQGDGRGRENAKREVIWFSPHCLTPNQIDLFADMEAA